MKKEYKKPGNFKKLLVGLVIGGAVGSVVGATMSKQEVRDKVREKLAASSNTVKEIVQDKEKRKSFWHILHNLFVRKK